MSRPMNAPIVSLHGPAPMARAFSHPKKVRAPQRGFSLLEMVIAVGVAAVLASTAAVAINYMNENNTAANLGSGINQVYNAAGAYVTTNYSALINNQPVSGFANPMAPTIPELVAKQFLPPNFSATGYTGGTWRVQVQQTGTCPGATCNLLWLSYLDKAPTQNGKVNLLLTSDAALKSGVPAGFSSMSNPGTIIGLRGSWNTPNPLGNQPAILAAEGSYNSSQFAAYLPRSGALPMTGDLQMTDANGAHNIVGANNVSANTATLAPGNSLKIGNQVYYGDGTNAAVRTTGGFYVQNANGTGPADLSEVNNINADGTVTMANGKVIAWNQVPEGGVLQLTGANGVKMYLESLNGTFRLVNDPWNAQLFSVDQSGNVAAANSITGNVLGGNYVYSNGTMAAQTVAAQTVQANNVIALGTNYGAANPGWGCGPNGAIAANANGSGQLMTCTNGAWQQASGGGGFSYFATWAFASNGGSADLGWWKACWQSGFAETGGSAMEQVNPVSGPNGSSQFDWVYSSPGGNGSWIRLTCAN